MKTEAESLKILYTDGDEETLSMTSELLKKRGLLTIAAKTAETALQKLKQEKFNLLVTGWQFSPEKMNGIGLIRAIRDDPTLKSIPIIMLTGHVYREDQKLATEAGVDLYLTKPISTDSLVSQIKTVIKEKEKELLT